MDESKTRTRLITASIDGREVRVAEGTTILRAASEAGIYIPSLCHLDGLPAYGGCRLCLVEVENMRGFPTACTTPVAEGMKVRTTTDEIRQLRRDILELLLSEHPYTCLVCKEKKECAEYMHSSRKVGATTGCNFCPGNGACELQRLVDHLGLEEIRYPIIYRNIPPVRDNPFYELDYNLCILCGRCVRICNEERIAEVLAFINRGNAALVGTAFRESQKEAGCEYCGACVDVCPTGALSEKMGKWAGPPERSTETHCLFCAVACRMTVNSRAERPVTVGPAPENRGNPHQLCLRGKFISADIGRHPERVERPHINREGKWREVGWEEALEVISRRLKEVPGERFGLIGSAHDTVENSFLLQKFARRTMRSANVDLFPAASYPALVRDIHDYYAACGHPRLDDIVDADAVYVLGARSEWSHPLIENRIRKAARAGREVHVACSTDTRTAQFATTCRRYAPGSEHHFVHRLAGELARGRRDGRVVLLIGDEVLNSSQAPANVATLVRLARRSPDRIRLLFLLAEGNRYGATLAGMNPVLLPGFATARKKGFGTAEMLAGRRRIEALHLVGDIPATPALKRLRFFVQQNLFFTPASAHADVFLPLATSLESSGRIINLEGRLLPLTQVVEAADRRMSPGVAVNLIARRMRRKPLYEQAATDVDGLLRPILEAGLTQGRRIRSGPDKAPEPDSRSKNGRLSGQNLRKYHFHYLGNALPDLVPDLREVLEE